VSLPYVDQAIKEAQELLKKDAFVGIAIPTIVKDKVSVLMVRQSPILIDSRSRVDFGHRNQLDEYKVLRLIRS
jgi:hypothetical protein